MIFLVLLCVLGVHCQRDRAIVNTRQGTLLGREEFVNGRRIYSFRGIKYAESPARQRFTYSRPYTDSWSGTKSAVEDGLPCPQPFLDTEYSEDCLHVSVWTPGLPRGGLAQLPVLVYLTGNNNVVFLVLCEIEMLEIDS